MPDLFSTLGVNSQTLKHNSFNYCTPAVYPLVLVHGDSWSGHELPGSDLYKVINYLQGRGVEIYGIGQVSGNTVTILTNWGKVPEDDNDSQDPDDTSDIDLLTSEISTLLSITCRVWYGKIQGSNISYDC